MAMESDDPMAARGPHSNALGGDYPLPRPTRDVAGGAYAIKRGTDPRGFYDLDNLHTPSAPRDASCDLTPFIDD